MVYRHIPVLINEVIQYLNPRPNQNFIDCTLGGGGHAEKILGLTGPRGKLLGIDLDPTAIMASRAKLSKYQDRIILVQGNYKNINKIIYERRFNKIHGVLLDLGLSSAQLKDGSRGFSFQDKEYLDMRFDGQSSLPSAMEILNTWPEKELEKIFREYGEEKLARGISKKISEIRKKQKFETTDQLVNTILSVYRKRDKIHPATKIFQALRIAVNDELANLQEALPRVLEALEPGGRLAVISFHSLEDRIVKNFFRQEARGCVCPKESPICQCGHRPRLKIITKKPVTACLDEVQVNPSSRSAKLRVAEKLN